MSQQHPHFHNEKPQHLYRWGFTQPDEVLGWFIDPLTGHMEPILALQLDKPRNHLDSRLAEFLDTVDECNATSGLAIGLPEAGEIRGEGKNLVLRNIGPRMTRLREDELPPLDRPDISVGVKRAAKRRREQRAKHQSK